MCRAVHPVHLLLAGLLIVACRAAPAPAAAIDVSLNVLYNHRFSDAFGGTWQIAAKSDEFGIYGLQVGLVDIDTAVAAGPIGMVNGSDPAGFSEFNLFDHAATWKW